MKGRRILYVDSGRSFGGAERITLALASSFAAAGAEVACLVSPGAGPFREELARIGIEAVPFPETDSLARALACSRAVRRFRPDILHIHRTWPLSDRYASPAAKRGGAGKVIATEHVRWEACGLRDRTAKRILARFDDRIVAVSGAVRESLLRYWKIDPGRVVVIRNGIRADAFRPGGAKDGEDPFPRWARLRIGTVGRLEKQKGIDVLLEAFARLRKERPEAALVVVGDGSLRGELEERARLLGLGDAVRFAGSVPDAGVVLSRLDLFVLASRWEGLPLTLLEAMAAGVPVVATSVDGTVEAVRQGTDGLLVPPEDPEALHRAIAAALSEPGASRERAESARRRVVEEFSIERMVNDYRRVYES
ncbi:MAG: glycosyltransferase [Candidatus Eisenbacteria bacterium]